MVGDAARERETFVVAAIAEVVEENAADTARLVAVLEKEILVAPALEPGIVRVTERREGIAAGAVKVNRVFLEAVVRREVGAAAEPPDRIRALLAGDEHAHVHVHRRHVGVERMQHERHAHDLEATSRELRPSRARRGRQALAHHVRKIHAGALEQAALLEDAAFAAATLGPRPRLAPECPAVERLEPRHDARLQRAEPLERGGDVHDGALDQARRAASAREPMSLRYCMPSKWMRPTAA